MAQPFQNREECSQCQSKILAAKPLARHTSPSDLVQDTQNISATRNQVSIYICCTQPCLTVSGQVGYQGAWVVYLGVLHMGYGILGRG